MKAVVILMVLIVTAYCLPAKRSASSSESSEERVVAQRPVPMARKAAAKLIQAEPTQAPPVDSNESTDSADDTEETNSSESESGETVATPAPPTEEPTLNPVINTGRGDSMGYPSDNKKSIVYVDAKYFEKIPSPYKSYSSDKMGGLTMVNKKMFAYDGQNINDVEKEIKLYKAVQVLEEEDTSTPEIEAVPGDSEVAPVGNKDTEGASAGDSPSASASASQEEKDEADSSPSSEETTATPGAADSDSDSSQSTESQESDEDTTQTTKGPVVIAK